MEPSADLNRTRAASPQSHEISRPDPEEISDLAFRLWNERGCPEGSPDVDWLEAERRLTEAIDADDGTQMMNAESPDAVERI